MRVEINPNLLRWACERAGLNIQIMTRRLPHLPAWEEGRVKPTLKQIEKFADIVHVPVGFLFLPEPPTERIPIPDFRIIGNERRGRPSPDMLETIYLCQQRQEWYQLFSRTIGEAPCSFAGSATLNDSIEETAARIRQALKFDVDVRRQFPTWEEALRQFIAQADEAGILVMVSGVVGSNTRRKLDHEEFRGFALFDEVAPLVFINGADTKSAQMFTLAHELAHIWLGKTGLSDVSSGTFPTGAVEQWCNRVAAEILVPTEYLKGLFHPNENMAQQITRLARYFKVSTLVIIRRIYDLGFLSLDEFTLEYHAELERLLAIMKGHGGNFYLTQTARISKRFARALIISTLEGQTLHRDAFQLMGFSKVATFREFGNRLGVL